MCKNPIIVNLLERQVEILKKIIIVPMHKMHERKENNKYSTTETKKEIDFFLSTAKLVDYENFIYGTN